MVPLSHRAFAHRRNDDARIERTVWIDTLSQAANVALAGLLCGQFVSDRPFSIILAVGGVAAWSALLGWSAFLARSRNR